jgi:hypothetical protein
MCIYLSVYLLVSPPFALLVFQSTCRTMCIYLSVYLLVSPPFAMLPNCSRTTQAGGHLAVEVRGNASSVRRKSSPQCSHNHNAPSQPACLPSCFPGDVTNHELLQLMGLVSGLLSHNHNAPSQQACLPCCSSHNHNAPSQPQQAFLAVLGDVTDHELLQLMGLVSGLL